MTNWTIFYQNWHRPMLRYAQQLLKDSHRAEDLVHDLFLHLLEKGITPAFIHNAEAYLKRAVYLRCIRTLTAKKTTALTVDTLSTHETENRVYFRELENLHLKAVKSLPEQQKNVYILHYFAGYNKSEMALMLHASPKTIKKQLQTSRQKVRISMMQLRA